MNTIDVMEELKILARSMSEIELEQAVNILLECKSKNYSNNARDKSEYAGLVSTTKKSMAWLEYYTDSSKTGKLMVYGASVLSSDYFVKLYKNIPVVNCSWPLRDYGYVNNHSEFRWNHQYRRGRIRPILFVLDSENDGLKIGEFFYIGDEKFKLISKYIGIKVECLGRKIDLHGDREYINRVMKEDVEKWYVQLKERAKKEV